MTLEGKLSDCYRMFHSYSFGNQILAMAQLAQAEPINTYRGWFALGRQVKRGEHAIELCMPITCKSGTKDEAGKDEVFARFIFRRNWFGLSQTEGEEYALPEAVGFDKQRVLTALNIAEVPFSMVNGNIQGYSIGRELAISPICKHQLKTLWHELAHIVLGHTEQMASDTEKLPRNLAEVEAESVAYLLANVFDCPEDLADSRGYIQNWLKTESLPEANAKRIFKTVTDILKANEIKEREAEQ